MKSNVKRLFAGPYILWMIGFTIIPLLLIVYYGLTTKSGTFTLANVCSITTPEHMKALLLSLGLSLAATAICLLLSYPLALVLRRRGIGAGAGCSTGNLFESGALAGFLWWISGGIPSLSVQNRKKHLHRSEPYDGADGGIAGELAGRTRLSRKRLCCGRGESKPASADGPAGAGTAGTGIAAVRTTA